MISLQSRRTYRLRAADQSMSLVQSATSWRDTPAASAASDGVMRPCFNKCLTSGRRRSDLSLVRYGNAIPHRTGKTPTGNGFDQCQTGSEGLKAKPPSGHQRTGASIGAATSERRRLAAPRLKDRQSTLTAQDGEPLTSPRTSVARGRITGFPHQDSNGRRTR